MKKSGKFLILAGIGAAVGYSAWKGVGPFNKLRFKKQYDALQSYTDTHYPGATIGEIVPFEEGWNCNILYNEKNVIIHIIPNENDGFIFNPTEM